MADLLTQSSRNIPVVAILIDSGIALFLAWDVVRDHLLERFTEENPSSLVTPARPTPPEYTLTDIHRSNPLWGSLRTELPVPMVAPFSFPASLLKALIN